MEEALTDDASNTGTSWHKPRGPKDQATSIEDQIRYSYFSPPPTQYDINFRKNTTGGLISTSEFTSQLDEQAKTMEGNPSPDTYLGPGEFIFPSGGRVYPPKPPKESEINVSILVADPGPGPGRYHPPSPKKNETMGSFTKDIREPKYINDAIRQTEGIPPVGHYNSAISQEFLDPFLPAGGAVCNQVKLPSYFDEIVKTHDGVPDPTEYAHHGKIELKAVGKPQYKFVSETMNESKKLVRKALATDIPGPGAYTVPELNAGKSCTMQGRALGHGMPAPYNYNSQPDLARKFIPVRQANNGDLIFGRRFRTEEETKLRKEDEIQKTERTPSASSVKSRNGDACSDVSEVASDTSNLHEGWIEGGFQKALSKSRSAPGHIQKAPVHASVQNAARYYPSLAGHIAKETKTFLPMAARRLIAIPMDSQSQTYTDYLIAKQSLRILAEDLAAATKSAIEPFDTMSFVKSTSALLAKKVSAHMRIEGYPKDKIREITASNSRHLEALLGMGPTPPAPRLLGCNEEI